MDAATNNAIIEGMAYEKERQGPPEGFPAFPRIPAGRYLDPDFLELEHQYMWRRSWLYALHTDELPEVGSYRLWDRMGSPILIVRAGDNDFRAYYNTCAHRGAPLVQNESGRRKLFVCPYHGWSYDLQGDLKAVRDPRDFVDFDKSCHKLKQIRCEAFGNWLFVNEDLDAAPLLESIAPFPEHWSTLDLDNIAHIDSATYVIDCNVKVLLDAFMETYHLASIHQMTVNRFLDHLGTYIQLFPRGNMLMVTPQRSPDWKDPGAKGMPRIETATEVQRVHNPSYHFFPNLVAPVSDSGMPFLAFWPIDSRTMRIDSHWFAPREAVGHENWDVRISNWTHILEEDTQFAPDIQKSVESGGFQGLALSYQERRIYYWHEEVDRRIGVDRIPEHLRVTPVMAPLVQA
ncbi:MAG: aromatic ring-hydroxylating dioxygenase subunit alpha [Xanthomonadales bacterium]|nr:aromatic ring-hydroxylating dioxygenase subunit alpha [Xanthomonadales bacterium]